MYLSLLLGFLLFLKKLEPQQHKMFTLRHNCEIKMSQIMVFWSVHEFKIPQN